jgi:hypothetical protein
MRERLILVAQVVLVLAFFWGMMLLPLVWVLFPWGL